MTWVPWLYSAVLVINIGVTLTMSKWMHDIRVVNQSLRMEVMASHRFVTEILDRTEGLIPCDGCGKRILADQPAAVRITPTGTVFGHVMCLPPMPTEGDLQTESVRRSMHPVKHLRSRWRNHP